MAKSNIKRLALILAISAGLAISLSVRADTFSATATVSNVITMTETQALDFGSVYAISGGGAGDVESMSMTPGGVITYGGTGTISNLVSLGGQTPGIIDLSGMAANTTVTVTSGGEVDLNNGNPASATFVFVVSDDTAGSLTTDGTGAGTINIGGSITTEDTANTFQDGIYTGSYDVTVSY